MIYFALAIGSRTVKIGHTTGRSKDRLAALSTGCPHDLVLLHAEFGDPQRESALHKQFEGLAVRGEWFRLEGELLEFVVTRLIETLHPWDFEPHAREDPACVESLNLIAEEAGSGGSPHYLWHVDGHVNESGNVVRSSSYLWTDSPTDLLAVHSHLKERGYELVYSARMVWTMPAILNEGHRIILMERLNG